MESYLIDDGVDSKITPLFVGWQCCEEGHSFGPFVRDCYLIHFCLRGCGVLKNPQGEFSIESGSFFVIRPGEITTYIADQKNPWEYAWIAFRAEAVTYFDGEAVVFDTPAHIDDRLMSLVRDKSASKEACLAIIYDLLDRVFRRDHNDEGDERIRQVRRYIKYNYMLPITVSGLARNFGFERSYLYRMFKNRYGKGIKEYIVEVRLSMGAKFLSQGFSVKESAHMVGYDDEFNFSKAFKAKYGINPSEVKRHSETLWGVK